MRLTVIGDAFGIPPSMLMDITVSVHATFRTIALCVSVAGLIVTFTL
jgi:hypothetical protein